MAWLLITQGDGQNSHYMEFLIDSANDIKTPPQEYSYAPSSLAHTPGYKHIYEADRNGNWIEIGNGGGDDPDDPDFIIPIFTVDNGECTCNMTFEEVRNAINDGKVYIAYLSLPAGRSASEPYMVLHLTYFEAVGSCYFTYVYMNGSEESPSATMHTVTMSSSEISYGTSTVYFEGDNTPTT